MTEHDMNVARELGGLQADMRTVKHDITNISAKLDVISTQLTSFGMKQSKNLGFFAGAAFIITTCSGAFAAICIAAWNLFKTH